MAREWTLELEAQLQEQHQRLADLAQVDQELGTQTKHVASLRTLVDRLAVDRLILVELRKDLPEERQPAAYYWGRIKGLAAQSEPSLSSTADKVLKALPVYFSWSETTFASPEAQSAMYDQLLVNRYLWQVRREEEEEE